MNQSSRLLIGIALSAASALCQNAWVNDREIIQSLRNEGVRLDRESAILYFEKDALTEDEMNEFSDLVERGVKDIENLLKMPDESRRANTSRINYFISGQIDIGRARFRSIMLPLWRVKRKQAPYLHETTHVLAPCNHCPMWFSEGFASWVQSYVSENVGGYDALVFARRGNRGVDREAAHWLSTENGQSVLPFVLEGGEPPDIVEQRQAIGAPFYVLAQSLVKYLVATAGIEQVTALCGAGEFESELARITSKKPEDVKSGWLFSLKTVASGPTIHPREE